MYSHVLVTWLAKGVGRELIASLFYYHSLELPASTASCSTTIVMFGTLVQSFVLLGACLLTTQVASGTSLEKRTPNYESPFLGYVDPGSCCTSFDDTGMTKDAYKRISKMQLWCGPNVVTAMQSWFDGVPGIAITKHKQWGLPSGGVYKELLVNSNEYINHVRYDLCSYSPDGPPSSGDRICYLVMTKAILGTDQVTGMVTCGEAIPSSAGRCTMSIGVTTNYKLTK